MIERDWILYRGRTFQFHTHLRELLAPLRHDIREFKWFLSDIDYLADNPDIPINFDKDYFILDKDEFEVLLSHDIQFIWGSILGFHNDAQISFNPKSLPYVEANDDIWIPGNTNFRGKY